MCRYTIIINYQLTSHHCLLGCLRMFMLCSCMAPLSSVTQALGCVPWKACGALCEAGLREGVTKVAEICGESSTKWIKIREWHLTYQV